MCPVMDWHSIVGIPLSNAPHSVSVNPFGDSDGCPQYPPQEGCQQVNITLPQTVHVGREAYTKLYMGNNSTVYTPSETVRYST